MKNECDGCCYRKHCDHEIEKCQYLVNWKCLIRESRTEESLNGLY
jgi:hypothetical protein